MDFIKLARIPALYEKAINRNNKKSGTLVLPISLKTSIGNADLQIFIATGWADPEKVGELTEEQLAAHTDLPWKR